MSDKNAPLSTDVHEETRQVGNQNSAIWDDNRPPDSNYCREDDPFK